MIDLRIEFGRVVESRKEFVSCVRPEKEFGRVFDPRKEFVPCV